MVYLNLSHQSPRHKKMKGVDARFSDDEGGTNMTCHDNFKKVSLSQRVHARP